MKGSLPEQAARSATSTGESSATGAVADITVAASVAGMGYNGVEQLKGAEAAREETEGGEAEGGETEGGEAEGEEVVADEL
jgi:hypothetical protein